MTELVVEPGLLDFVDVVTSSHNHTDHLDAATLQPILAANTSVRLVIPEANRLFVSDRLSCRADLPVGLSDGQSVQVRAFQFHGIAAAHDDVDRDREGRCHFLGYVLTFGGFAIYHSGDTIWHRTLLKQLEPFDIDVALLPINGKLPQRKVAGNLWGQEAAALASDLGAKLVVPCHYDMFTFNTETPDAFVSKCRDLNQPHRVLRCGERLLYPGDLN